MSISQTTQRRHALLRIISLAPSTCSTWTTSASFRIRVGVLHAGHLLNLAAACGFNANEYRGRIVPNRPGVSLESDVMCKSGYVVVH